MLVVVLSAATVVSAQQITGTRRADIRGGGGGDGKCTIEVWVDDVAEVEIRGAEARIRTLSGQPASFRRFQCNQEMPRNPGNFRFSGVDGRGRQSLVRTPDRGAAVVRIEDSKGGGEGYTFDITWSGSSGGGNWGGGRGRGDWGANNGSGYGSGNGPGWGNGNGNGWGNNNGWGNGSGWGSGGNFTYEGGNRGSGRYRDRNGNERRLDGARVSISQSGSISVQFQGEQGRLDFNGNIDRRQGRRVFGRVSGGGAAAGANGTMEIEMASGNQVRSIRLPDIDLNWSN